MRGFVEESTEVATARYLRDAARKLAGTEILYGYGTATSKALDALLAAAIAYAATQKRPRAAVKRGTAK